MGALKGRGELGWAAMTETGPNDARCVVWALGTSLISSLRVFFLTSFSYFFNVFLAVGHPRAPENSREPKRRV